MKYLIIILSIIGALHGIITFFYVRYEGAILVNTLMFAILAGLTALREREKKKLQ